MTCDLVVQPLAEQEITEAHDWYEERSLGLGKDFLLSIDAALQSAARNPRQFPIVHGKIRRAGIRHDTLLCHYVNMRTTVDLPDDLFRSAKALSSLRGISLKALIARALEHELESSTIRLRPRRITFPIIPSERPGSVRVTSDRIARILEAEDAGVSS